MTNAEKIAYLNNEIAGLKNEQWKLDAAAKALNRAGLKERAEAIAKQSGESQLIIDAFNEQIAELQTELKP